MAFYDKFPYTNFQELNLDWLTQEVSKVRDNRDATDASAAAALDSEQAAKASETAAKTSETAAKASETAAAESASGIEAAREQIYLNKARLDNLIVDGTPTQGNTELLDIRVGDNGVTYSTAGDAVRGQYEELDENFNQDILSLMSLKPIGFISGKSITTSGETGTKVPDPGTNPMAKYAKIACSAGDKIIIWGTGGISARLWAFVDSSDAIITKSSENDSMYGEGITAPANTAAIIINVLLSSTVGAAFIRKSISNAILPNYYIGSKGVVNSSNILFNDANSIMVNAIFSISSTITDQMIANLPKYGVACVFESVFGLDHETTTKFGMQIARYKDDSIYTRWASFGEGYTIFGDWISYTSAAEMKEMSFVKDNGSILQSGTPQFTDANKAIQAGVYFLSSSVTQNDVLNLPEYGTAGEFTNLVSKLGGAYSMTQIVKYISNGNTYIRGITFDSVTQGGNLEKWHKIETVRDYVVDKAGSGDYTSLTECLTSIPKNNARVRVKAGVYDLKQEFIDKYGTSYFDDLTADYKAGLFLSGNIIVTFDQGAKVIFNYDGNNPNVKKGFSPFNAVSDDLGGFTLVNADIYVKNGRYCVHDEHDGIGNYTNKYIGCRMEIDNTENKDFQYSRAIGGGLGKHGYIEIHNCYFKNDGNLRNDKLCVSYHNGNNAEAESKIIFSNNFCDGGTFGALHYGPSTIKSVCYVNGNSLDEDPILSMATGGTVENMEIVKWNNEIQV